MRRGVAIPLVIVLVLAASAVTALGVYNAPPLYEGTLSNATVGGESYHFRAYGDTAQNALEAGDLRLKSLYNIVQGVHGSDVENVNLAAGGMVGVDPATYALAYKAKEYNERTLGRFSVCDGNARRAYGLEDGERQEGLILALESDPGMEGLVLNAENLEIGVINGTRLTLDALLSAYALDQTAAIGRDYGVKNAMYQMGDRAVAIGGRPDGGWWTYAVPHPDGLGPLGVLMIKDQAVATVGAHSGLVEAEGRFLPAVISPVTHAPVDQGVISVTVVADTAVEAAALARTLLAMSRQEGETLLRSFPDVQALSVGSDGSVYWTAGLQRHFSLRGEAYR